MKKVSFSGILLIAVLTVIGLSACQKEQQSTSAQSSASVSSTESGKIAVVAGTSNLPGQITPSYAAALAYNYSKKYDGYNQTQYVSFSAADLIAFINGLKAKYGSDIVYVNFGVYGQGAPALNSKDNGRLTVFFTGNKIPAPSVSNRKSDGLALLTDPLDEFLNHGDLIP